MRVATPASVLIPAELQRSVADLRQQIARVSQEAVTGRAADLSTHLSGAVGEAMLSQRAVDALTAERASLSLTQTRLDLTQQSLSRIHSGTLGIDMRMHAAIGTGDEAAQGAAARDARAALEEVFRGLEVRHGERFLFSGDATGTPPLSSADALLTDISALAASATDGASFNTALNTYFNSPTGGWQQSVYAGTATASDENAVTAIDPALSELIAGLSVLALADPKTGPARITDDAVVTRAAADRLTNGREALTQVRARLGIAEEDTASRLIALDAEETVLTRALNDLTAVDPFEAASRLRELETTLEAAYLLTSRLAGLSLLNYMR